MKEDPGLAADTAAAVRKKVDADLDHNRGLKTLADAIRDGGAAHPTSPTREILERLGDRWSPLLLSVLETGRYRHGELHRLVNKLNRLVPKAAISQRMLTLRLRALERDGLVHRSVGEGNAPTVHYTLTPLGQSMMWKLQPLLDWSVEHTDEIRTAQRSFDAQDGQAAPPLARQRHRTR